MYDNLAEVGLFKQQSKSMLHIHVHACTLHATSLKVSDLDWPHESKKKPLPLLNTRLDEPIP